eukprot:TRINITY_DN8561_c0_g1_i1.p1 TRINITY_DN8561_c0_g1~~TRINITY_DN8561_c0_g1_i1.p1  ORF type:complete len:235 (+),score=33.78 TRINITY_DN8561_c0_g1_i1:75-707(+)
MDDDQDDAVTSLIQAAARDDEKLQSEQRAEAEAAAARAPRVFQALSCVPQDMVFTIPLEAKIGDPVCVQGPCGPLCLPFPAGKKPGEQASMRLGPPPSFNIKIPEGHEAGKPVNFKNDKGEIMQTQAPADLKPGDNFDIYPPAMMVQVPFGARPGDTVSFDGINGQTVTAQVPPGMQPGTFFASLEEPVPITVDTDEIDKRPVAQRVRTL